MADTSVVSLLRAGTAGQEFEIIGERFQDGMRRTFFICIYSGYRLLVDRSSSPHAGLRSAILSENRTEGKHLRSQTCEADQSTLSAAGRGFVQPAQRRTHDSLRTKTLNAPRIAGGCCRCEIRGAHARSGRSQQPAAAYAGRVRSRPLGGVHGCQPGPLLRFALGRLLATDA